MSDVFCCAPLLALSNQTSLRIPQRSRTDVFGLSMKFTRVYLHWIGWSWVKRKCVKMRMFCRRYNVAIQQLTQMILAKWFSTILFFNLSIDRKICCSLWSDEKKMVVIWCNAFDSTVHFDTYRQTIMSEYIYCIYWEVLMHHFAEQLALRFDKMSANIDHFIRDLFCCSAAAHQHHCIVRHMTQYRIHIASNPHRLRGKLSSSARSDSKAQWNRLINLCCRCVQCAMCTEHSYLNQSLGSVRVGNGFCKKHKTIRHTTFGHSPVWQHSSTSPMYSFLTKFYWLRRRAPAPAPIIQLQTFIPIDVYTITAS